MYDLTVIIPTYNEEANIKRIITEVNSVLKKENLNGEILVVDDNSPDGTITTVKALKKTINNLNLIVRPTDHGLSQSVVAGFREASSDIFVVIDADLSHPPTLIPKMYHEIKSGNDIVIGSRYMEGGGIKKWPLKRRVISIGATILGRFLFPEITDPVSGFFAVKRSVLAHAALKPQGYKILLEILGKGSWNNDKEIPYDFVDRETGSSKLKIQTMYDYTRQIIGITFFSFMHREAAAWREWKKILKFGIVGISGIVVNEGVLIYLREFIGLSIPVANIFSIELSVLNNFIWNDLWTFKSIKNRSLSLRWHRLLSFHFVSAGGAIINYCMVNFFPVIFRSADSVDYRILNIVGILFGFSWNFIINRHVTWKSK
jgi:dolichol-phosphate mannosyltransferase